MDVIKELKFLGKFTKTNLGRGGQGGCDRRIEVFGKIHKKPEDHWSCERSPDILA